jgi:hypothetical protein
LKFEYRYEFVDLGAARNGRVALRKVFKRGAGRPAFIVERGKRVDVLRISRALAGINYVRQDQR